MIAPPALVLLPLHLVHAMRYGMADLSRHVSCTVPDRKRPIVETVSDLPGAFPDSVADVLGCMLDCSNGVDPA